MKKLFFAAAVVLFLYSLSFSQIKGKVGLDFMLRNEFNINLINLQPTIIPTVGVRYNPIENLGVRGRLSYVSSKTEYYNYYYGESSIPKPTFDLSNKNVGLGIDVYYYVYNKAGFHIYTGTGFTYSFIKQDYVNPLSYPYKIEILTTYQRQTRIFSGVQYSFNENFSTFGEIGIEYLRGDYTDFNNHNLGTSKWNLANGGIGITFTF